MIPSRHDPPRALHAAVALLSLAAIATWLAIAASRAAYPFDLEWMEGCSVEQVARVLAGERLYVPPSVDFVPTIYTPLYFWVSAAVAAITGIGYLPLRLVSIASTLASLGLLGLIVRRETGRTPPALLAMGLFAATFSASGGWFDLARVDAFALALLLAFTALIRCGRGRASGIVAGGVLALAWLAKQTVLVAGAPLLAHAIVCHRRRGLAATAAFAGGVAALGAALQAGSDGWFGYYTFTLPEGHAWVGSMLAGYWKNDLFGPLPLAVLATTHAMFALVRAGDRPRCGFWVALGIGFLGASWLSRLHSGGWLNVLMPAHAGLALLAAIGYDDLERRACSAPRRKAAVGALAVAVAAQFAWTARDPRAALPDRSDRAAGERLLARLARLEGDVWVPGMCYATRRAGIPSRAHAMAIADVVRGDDGPIARQFAARLERVIADGRFRWIAIHDPRVERDWLPAAFAERYVPYPEPLFDRPDVFFPVTGAQRRPDRLFVAR